MNTAKSGTYPHVTLRDKRQNVVLTKGLELSKGFMSMQR